MYYFATAYLYICGTLAGLFLLQMVWSRLEGAWKGWRARRRLNDMQSRLVDEVEELDVCNICFAEYAAGEEVSSKF